MAAVPPTLNLPDLLDLNQFDDARPCSEEAPRIALDLIDEDPKQPRKHFDLQTLQELADSIRAAGDVLQPVSLRLNPDAPGRYIVNLGHRRCRAARMVGLADVPYFIAHKVDSFSQVIENEQRENLSPMELGLFIRDRMAEGMEQQEIARRLGKSKGYISKAAALAEAPAVVAQAWRDGKLAGVTEAYELRNLHRDYPETVERWANGQREIGRSSLAKLRQRLAAPATQSEPAPVAAGTASTEPPAPAAEIQAPGTPVPAKAAAADAAGQTAKPALASPLVMAQFKGQPLVLDVTTVPPTPGHFYARRPGSTRRQVVPAVELRLIGFFPG